MKSTLKYLFVLLVAGVAFAMPAKASHVAGVDITYQCLGNDSFLVTVNVFRDCSGASWTANQINVNFSSTCGQNFNIQLPTTNALNGTQAIGVNVSQLCPTAISNCNPGGTHPGMLLYTYQAIVVLNPPCNTWTIGYAPPCCRNNNLNLLPNQGNTFVSSTLNSVTDSCNNSPTIATTNPNPYACVGQLICYDLGVTEIDGDSLVYSFDTAYQNATTPFGYNAGYSAQVPIPGITIDPATGNIQFTPMVAGNYVIVIKICEYDRNTGALKGCITRDLQWVVNTCNNAAPSQLCNPNSIVNFSGSGALVGPNEVEVCYGQNFSFVILVSDSFGLSSSQYLTATTNVQSVLPGSQFSVVSNTAQDSLWITVSWVATLGAAPFNTFNVNVSDNNCPVTATNSGTYIVRVIPSTYGGPDHQICKGIETANLNAIGGTQFTWSVISGDPNSLSCTNCANTVVNPNTTTEYQVTSNLSSSCKNVDTVLVTVSQDYNIAMLNDTTICFNDSTLQIFAIPSRPNKTYSYEWWPKNFMDDDTAQFPFATPIISKNYIVEVTSDSGCIKRDTMYLGVSPPFPSAISVSTNNSLACSGLSTVLDLSLGASPSSCGLASSPCIGPSFTSIVGTGNNQNTTNGTGVSAWPTPYGNSEGNARQQYLYLASELAAQGMAAGKITGLSFDLVSNNGATSYYGYTIKMGCTSNSTLTNWVTGLSTVFNGKTITVSNPGLQNHQFDNIYEWDGTSNLVVEICFANPGVPTQNAVVKRTNPNFNCALYFASSNQAACNSTFLSSPPLSMRPNTFFDYCLAPDTMAYTYRWFPSTGLSDTTSMSPSATVSATSTYYVLIKDTFNACYDTAEITLNIANVFAGNDTSICPTDTLQLNAVSTASCAGVGSFIWKNALTGGPAVGLSNDSIPNPFVNISGTQSFALSFTDNCGCTVYDTITISLGQVGTPQITRTDPDCGVDNGSYVFNLSGGFQPYRFTVDGGQTFQLDDSVFNNLPIGSYTLFAIDSLGCPSDTIIDSLFNIGAPVLDSFKLTNVNCYNVPDGTIEVFASGGTGALSFSIDSAVSFQASNFFSGLAEGSFNIILQDADSCRNYATPFIITQPTELYYSFQAFNDTCHQLGDGYAIANAFGGTEPYTYNWSSSSQVDTIELNLSAGNYSLVISDSNNCTLDTNFVIEEPEEVRIDSIFTTDITCFGYNNGKIEVFASGGDSIFRYSVDSGLTYQSNLAFDSLAPGFYNITIIDQSLCRVDSFATLVEPPIVEVSTNTDSVKVCVSTCTDLIATASGGNGGPYTYSWSPNLGTGSAKNICPSKDIIYAVYAYDQENCVSEIQKIKINLFDSLDVLIPEDTFFCYGNSLPLDAVAIGGDGNGYNFEWTPYYGLNNPRIPNPTAFPDTTSTYTLKVWDNCGSTEIFKDILIEVYPIPQIDFSIDTGAGCEPLKLNLYNNSTQQFDCWINYGTGELIKGCGTSELEYTTAGQYDITVNVKSREGCENGKTIPNMVTVYPKPIASFTMSPQPTTVLLTEIEFTDLSEGRVVERIWNFGSFGSSEELNPIFEFPDQDSASYPVRLKVITDKECSDDTIRPVIIGQEYVMYVPSAFTPNGDNVNDVFLPASTGVDAEDFTFMIFDRWGKKIFESKEKTLGWDGTNIDSGEPAPAGIYVWKLVVGDYSLEKERHEYMGNLMLMR